MRGFVSSDAVARMPLWSDGLDYRYNLNEAIICTTSIIKLSCCRHGTGHGVGHFLNVHEGPHGIGVRIGKWSSFNGTGKRWDNYL